MKRWWFHLTVQLKALWNVLRRRPTFYRCVMYVNVRSNVWFPEPENDGLLAGEVIFLTTQAEGDVTIRIGPTDQIPWFERVGEKPHDAVEDAARAGRMRRMSYTPKRGWEELR